jgi:hypothetical protein
MWRRNKLDDGAVLLLIPLWRLYLGYLHHLLLYYDLWLHCWAWGWFAKGWFGSFSGRGTCLVFHLLFILNYLMRYIREVFLKWLLWWVVYGLLICPYICHRGPTFSHNHLLSFGGRRGVLLVETFGLGHLGHLYFGLPVRLISVVDDLFLHYNLLLSELLFCALPLVLWLQMRILAHLHLSKSLLRVNALYNLAPSQGLQSLLTYSMLSCLIGPCQNSSSTWVHLNIWKLNFVLLPLRLVFTLII